jgi:hypothetical protein
MRDCEHYEILVSAWQDGELDRSGQVEMLDHLVRCAGCREFYLGSRGLAGLVAAVRPSTAGERASPEVWSRIEESARARKAGRTRRAGGWWRILPLPAWAAAGAAAAALFVILGTPPGELPSPADPRTAVTEIRLGGNPGGMDEARFLEVTKMVLGADRKYRSAFYEIMKQVVEDTQGSAPSMDPLPQRGESRFRVEPPETVRGPS